MTFVLLPGGTPKIGAWKLSDEHAAGEPFVQDLKGTDIDEEPVHEVALDPFLLSKYEMTQAQWERIMESNPSAFSHGKRGGPTFPVNTVSWFNCQEAMRRLDLDFATEAQYEYAARAGSGWTFSHGADLGALQGYANIADEDYVKGGGTSRAERIKDGFAYLAPVGSLKPNKLGLHDMHGNVWSWCKDAYAPYSVLTHQNFSHQAGDGELVGSDAKVSGGTIRGGGFTSDSSNVRTSNRFAFNRGNHDGDLGIRPARELRDI